MVATIQAQGTLGTVDLNNYDNDGSSSSPSGNTAIWQGAVGTSADVNSTFVQILGGSTSGNLALIASASIGGNPTAFPANSLGGAYNVSQGNYFDGGYGTVVGVGGGGTAFFEVQAWEGASTYALAQTTAGAWSGSTAIWSQAVGSVVPAVGAPSPASFLMPTDIVMAQTQAVPEPSTLAMAGLGGFGMLMAMRRKKA